MWSCGILSFYEFDSWKFLVSEHITPIYVDTGRITSLQVAKSMKSSDKYSEQGRFMINVIWYHLNDHIKEGIVREDTRTEKTIKTQV